MLRESFSKEPAPFCPIKKEQRKSFALLRFLNSVSSTDGYSGLIERQPGGQLAPGMVSS